MNFEKDIYSQPKKETLDSNRPQNRTEEILSSFDLKEDKPISISVVREIILKNEKEITEGIARTFYHSIKSSLFARRIQAIRGTFYTVRRMRVETPQKNILDFVWFLQNPRETQNKKWKQVEKPKLIFTFSMNTERISQEEQKDKMHSFTGTDTFQLEKISIGGVSFGDLNRKETRESIPNLRESDSPDNIFASYESIKEFLEVATKPDELFIEANSQIEKIWEKYRFPPEEAQKLKQAIHEFGNYDFKTRDGYGMIGKCLIVPSQFEEFVRSRFGIFLKHCELTGAKKHRESYSLEERAELDAEKAGSLIHEASIYKETMIIDWTSRQFGREKSIPEIIDLNDNPALKLRIEIE